MSAIPCFPDFSPVTLETAKEFHEFSLRLKSGISEFSFANIYIDTLKYSYKVSRLSAASLVITGMANPRSIDNMDLPGTFFSVLGNMPDDEQLEELFARFNYWKNMPQELFDAFGDKLMNQGYLVIEDRDNFDYLYLRNDLVTLHGKAFHKKKNLVNAFCTAYSPEVRPLDIYTQPDALSVLESWKGTRTEETIGDYRQCRFALEQLAILGLGGVVVYADGIPVGFSLGEHICDGKMFVVMFEKGINSYKGVYQFVNRAQAMNLSVNVEYINREQDLGNQGLRQAKMTYRPCGFVKKHLVLTASS